MILGHECLKIGGGDVVWTALRGSPFHEKAVGNATKHAQDQDSVVALNPTPIIVVRDVQPLMQATLDAPALTIQV